MSEEILKALMQLFGIITKQGELITEGQRNYVQTFLTQQIGPDQVPEYMALFDKESGYDKQKEEGGRKKKLTSVGDSVRTLAACKKINKTLEQKQKIVVFVRILEIIYADENKNPLAMEIVDTVATVFKINPEEYKDIKTFVFETQLESFDSEQFLVADGTNRDESKQKKRRKIRKDDKKLNIKAKFLFLENFHGMVIFLKVPSAELYFTKCISNKNLFMGGLPIVEDKIYIFPHGSTIKLPTGKPIYYSEIVARYLKDSLDANITFNAINLEYVFPNGGKGLRGVTISEETGKLVGIMGASGAGKSTLLNVLNGNDKPTRGNVYINGVDIHNEKERVEGVIGYVPQDDLLIDELTVYENLYYNGKLCLDNLSDEELHTRIIDLLKALDLSRTKDLKVGNPLQKTISGGQRKRLNIGLELIREPAVMFVDEPTSGLSSRDSENIMDLLKELALKGKIIFVVIHQPSSDIYKMFDKMFILDTGGYPIYYGNPVEAIHYFKRKANQVGSASGECNSCGNVNPELIFNIVDAKLVDDYGRHLDGRKVSAKAWNRYFKEEFVIEKVEDAKEEPPSSLFIPTKIKQWFTFVKRDVLSKLKNTQYMWINSLEAPLLAFVLASIVKHAGDSPEYLFYKNENIPAYIFMSIVVALFMGLTVSAEEIIKDQRILKREKFLNLSKMSYLMSKVFILTSISAIQTISFVLVGNLMLGIEGMLWQYWLVLFSTAVFANVLGLNISASFNSAVTIYILIPLILIPQMILSGAMFSFDKINKVIGGGNNRVPILAEVMVSRWAFEALAVEQFVNNEFEKEFFYYHKVESELDYKLAYFIPEIKARINQCLKLTDDKTDEASIIYNENLEAVRDAIEKENLKIPIELQFAEPNLISAKNFNEDVASEIKIFLDDLNDHYSKSFVLVSDYLTNKVDEMERGFGEENYTFRKEKYSNEGLNGLLRNVTSPEKIKIIEGKFEQISDPVFRTPVSDGIGIRSHFYSPMKPFFGGYIFTYWFNLAVIWAMTLLAFISVYNDWMKKTLDYFASIEMSNIRIPIISNLIDAIRRNIKTMVIKRKKKKRDKEKTKTDKKKVSENEQRLKEKGKTKTPKLEIKGKTAGEEEEKTFEFKMPKKTNKTGSDIPGEEKKREMTENDLVIQAEKEERKRQREEKKQARLAAIAEEEAREKARQEAANKPAPVEEFKQESVVEEPKEELVVKAEAPLVEEKPKDVEAEETVDSNETTVNQAEVKKEDSVVENLPEQKEESTLEVKAEKTETESEVTSNPSIEEVKETPNEDSSSGHVSVEKAVRVPQYGQDLSDEERAEKERKREERRRKRQERLNRKMGGDE